MDAIIGGIEEITKQCHRSAFLLKTELRKFRRLLYFRDGVFPTFEQHFQFCIEFCSALPFGHRADDDTEILRLDTLDQLFQTATLLTTLDLCRDGYAVVKGYQYQIAPCETEFARQARTFGVDRFLDNLDEEFLAYFQCVGNTPVFFQLWLDVGLLDRIKLLPVANYLFKVFLKRIKLTSQVKIVQESYALCTDIDEAGIQSGHDLLDLCRVDVAYRERLGALLLLVFYQLLVFEQGYRDVFRLNIDDYFTCHVS